MEVGYSIVASPVTRGILERLRDWLIGPPPGTVPAPKDADEERSRQEFDALTPKGIADATARIMWAQRGALKVVVWDEEAYMMRGTHSPSGRKFRVTVPEGIAITFHEKLDDFTIHSTDGEQQKIGTNDGTTLRNVWRTIQATAIADAMGIDIPEKDGGLRPGLVLKAIGDAVCAIVERGDPPRTTETFEFRVSDREEDGPKAGAAWYEEKSMWRDLGSGVYLDPEHHTDKRYSAQVRESWYRLMTHELGTLRMDYAPMEAALERRKRSSFANALGIARALPAHLPMPRGNAQAARVLRLCREAVAREPGLVDAKGTPIAPLVEQHLPRLMQKHAQASAIAETSELAAIDAELMEGIERVRLAVEEALVVSRVDKREALRTELAFLEYRHPSPNILSLDAPEEEA